MPSFKVEIFDHTYHIRGELEEAYVAELAAYVDQRMRAVAEATGSVDTQRAAVLAALSLADELFTLRQQTPSGAGAPAAPPPPANLDDSVRDELRTRAERALELVERVLARSA